MMTRISDEKMIRSDAHTSVGYLKASLPHRADQSYLARLKAYCLDQGFTSKARVVQTRINQLEKAAHKSQKVQVS